MFNDRGYGILRWIQDLMFEGRRAAVDLHTPDFAMVAQSMGMPSWSVTSADEFDKAFAAAVDTSGPSLIDVDITGFEPMRIVPQSPSTAAGAGCVQNEASAGSSGSTGSRKARRVRDTHE